jgi:hypothetical protein
MIWTSEKPLGADLKPERMKKGCSVHHNGLGQMRGGGTSGQNRGCGEDEHRDVPLGGKAHFDPSCPGTRPGFFID